MRKSKNLVVGIASLFLLLTCQKELSLPKKPALLQAETAPADSLFAQADRFFDALRYDSAALLFQKIEDWYCEREDWEKHIACRRKTAVCFWASHESETAVSLCLQTLPLAREKLGGRHPEIARLHTVLGNIHADKRTEADFQQSLEHYRLALDITRQNFHSPHPDLALAYGRLGIAHWLIDDYVGALPWYERALACLDTLSPRNAAAHCKLYDNVALLYQSLGHYRKAYDYFAKARDVALHTLRQRDSKVVKALLGMAETRLSLSDADEALDLLREAWAIERETGTPACNLQSFILWDMGDCFMAKEDYAAATAHYRGSLEFWDANKKDHLNGLTVNLQKIGNAYLKQGQTAQALQSFQRASDLIAKGFGSKSFNRANALSLIGLAQMQQGDIPAARRYFQDALQITEKKVGNHHPATGRLKKQMAELSFKTGALGAATRQAAAARVSYLTTEMLPGEKPSALEVNNLTEFVETHHLLGKICAAQYQKNRDEAALRQSVSYFEEALSLTDSLKIGLVTKTARQTAQKQVFAIAEDALASLHQLCLLQPRPEYLEQVFHFMEKSKAAELLASLYDFDAKQSAGVTAAWLEREALLKSQMSVCQNLLHDPERVAQPDSDFKTALFQQRYFEIKRTLDSFLVALEKQFPKYHVLKYSNAVAALPQVKAFAATQNVQVIEYFYGNRATYALTISPDTVWWGRLENTDADSLDQSISDFLYILGDKIFQQTNPAAYFSAAYCLFQKLLPESALSSARSLVIVPDGRLCYLPFEALLTAPYEGNYAGAPYLLRYKSVQYAWSATLLTLPEMNKPGKNGLLQVAPFAESARDGLATLPNSLRDAPEGIGATVLDGAAAVTAKVLDKTPGHSVLHLSTHAEAGGREMPGIELYDRRLTLPEIYAQRFSMSLVSLSACETGKGRFAEGEGVLSLARAFAYAGVQSLVASYWQVNERSTAEIFSAFYENLKNGLPKAEALRQAKLCYLASPELDACKVPFHWAAFTLTGVDGRVDLGKSNPGKWLFALVALLLFAEAVFWRFKLKPICNPPPKATPPQTACF